MLTEDLTEDIDVFRRRQWGDWDDFWPLRESIDQNQVGDSIHRTSGINMDSY